MTPADIAEGRELLRRLVDVQALTMEDDPFADLRQWGARENLRRWAGDHAAELLDAEARAQKAERERDEAVARADRLEKSLELHTDALATAGCGVEREGRSKMRDISQVIDAMLKHVPADWTALRVQLEEIKRGAAYCAPEAMGRCWRKTYKVLENEIGALQFPWQRRVAGIFSGKETP